MYREDIKFYTERKLIFMVESVMRDDRIGLSW